MPAVNNKGVSGNSTSQMLARVTDLAPLTFDVCFFMGGTNDVDGLNVPSTTGNIGAILDYIATTLGKTVVILTITPRTHSSSPAAKKQFILDVNTYIMAQNGTRGGKVIAVDGYTPMNDGNNEPITGSTLDGLHLAPYGAYLVGNAIKTRLAGVYGDATLPDFSAASNICTNGVMAGTGGSGGSNIATGWTYGVFGPVTPSKTAGDKQRIVFSGTSTDGGNAWEIGQYVTTGYSNGDTLRPQVLVNMSNCANIDYFQVIVEVAPLFDQTLRNVNGFYESAALIAENYVNTGQMLITCPDLPISVGTLTSIRIRLRLQVKDAGIATASDCTILGMGLFKV